MSYECAGEGDPAVPVSSGADYERMRGDIFEALRRHDVSEQCFAEVAMITHAALKPTGEDQWTGTAPTAVEPMSDASARIRMARLAFPTMLHAFRTTTCGPFGHYMTFKFPDCNSVQAADEEWRTATVPTAIDTGQSEASPPVVAQPTAEQVREAAAKVAESVYDDTALDRYLEASSDIAAAIRAMPIPRDGDQT